MTGKKIIRPPADRWIKFDNTLRLQVLANHFGSIKQLSNYTGISPASLSATLSAINSGKNSRSVNRPDYVEGMRRARRNMTRQNRKVEKDFQAGKYTSPLIRHTGGIIKPKRYQIYLEQSKKVVDSFWLHYRVEHLPLVEQLEVARELFEWAMATGEFNTFRFEYIAEASHYLETAAPFSGHRRRTFKDTGLKLQYQESKIVKLSTRVYPLAESGGNSDEFLDMISEERAALLGRGLIRITDFAFTNMESYRGMMGQAQADRNKMNKRQIKNKPAVKRGNKKRGK